jgi:hypothetical protein
MPHGVKHLGIAVALTSLVFGIAGAGVAYGAKDRAAHPSAVPTSPGSLSAVSTVPGSTDLWVLGEVENFSTGRDSHWIGHLAGGRWTKLAPPAFGGSAGGEWTIGLDPV